MKRTINPITNNTGNSNPTTINSIDIIKNNGIIIGQNSQNNACSQGFHLGPSVNNSVTLYPNTVYMIPMHIHTIIANIRSITGMIPPLQFVKQVYHHTDLNGSF